MQNHLLLEQVFTSTINTDNKRVYIAGYPTVNFFKLFNKIRSYGLFLLSLTLVACNPARDHVYTTKERRSIDSTVRANRSLDSLESLLQHFSAANDKIGIIYTCKELGKRYRETSRFTEAIEQHRKGLNTAVELHDTLEIIQALNNIGTNFRRLGILDEASSYHYQALAYCEQYSDKKSHTSQKNRVVSLNGIGNVHLTLNNKEEADTVFRAALAGERELNSPLGQAINYANLGAIFESRNLIDSAWMYYRHSLEFNRQAKSDLGISLCHTHFGRLYEQVKKWDKALEEYRVAYDLMEKSSDRWHWLESCLALARVNISKGDLPAARQYLQQAKHTAEGIHSLEHLASVYNLYHLWYEKQGDCRKALDYYLQSIAYADSVSNTKNINHMQNVRVKYEREKSQREMELVRQNYETRQRLKNIVIIACLSVLLLAIAVMVFLWYALKMRSRNQRMMQQMEKVRTQFFTHITHEFRTPLTVILGIGKQIQAGKPEKGESLESLGTMLVRQGDNLLGLINQLLDISKIKSAVGKPDWRTGDVIVYLRMMVESYQALARQKHIELCFVPAETSVIMDFAPDYLRKIVRNLISNALKFTPENGKIFITSKQKEKHLLIRIMDTGRGIAKEDLPHIFEAFYQGENSQTGVGTGIGLSLVYQIIESIGGEIKVQSAPGKGSVFTVTLPIQHDSEEPLEEWTPDFRIESITAEVLPEEMSLPDKEQTNDTRPTLLIVEDNTDVSHYIGSQLKARYRVQYARNGDEGLEKVMELMPDLLITDLMMPGMDGYELCRQIRTSEISNHIPIIIISAKCEEHNRIEGLQAGADAYLYKPFNSDELNVRVEKLLEQRRLLREKYSLALNQGMEQTIKLVPAEQEFLNKLINIIYVQMNTGEFDGETISGKMFMSRSQLNRKILSITGYSTAAYILQIRMGKAKRLLTSDEETPIGEIAVKCGFADVAHFSRLFKQTCQMTPSQYRKRGK